MIALCYRKWCQSTLVVTPYWKIHLAFSDLLSHQSILVQSFRLTLLPQFLCRYPQSQYIVLARIPLFVLHVKINLDQVSTSQDHSSKHAMSGIDFFT